MIKWLKNIYNRMLDIPVPTPMQAGELVLDLDTGITKVWTGERWIPLPEHEPPKVAKMGDIWSRWDGAAFLYDGQEWLQYEPNNHVPLYPPPQPGYIQALNQLQAHKDAIAHLKETAPTPATDTYDLYRKGYTLALERLETYLRNNNVEN